MFENKIVNEETDISKAAVRGNHSSNTFMTQNLKALKQNSLNCITYLKKKIKCNNVPSSSYFKLTNTNIYIFITPGFYFFAKSNNILPSQVKFLSSMNV